MTVTPSTTTGDDTVPLTRCSMRLVSDASAVFSVTSSAVLSGTVMLRTIGASGARSFTSAAGAVPGVSAAAGSTRLTSLMLARVISVVVLGLSPVSVTVFELTSAILPRTSVPSAVITVTSVPTGIFSMASARAQAVAKNT
jgi:hypothetical protein